MMTYFDRAQKWWTGTRWFPQSTDWVPVNASRETPSTVGTSTVLSAASGTISVGQSVLLTATIAPGVATGSVVFSGPGFTSGAVAVSGGVATYTATPTASGTVTASFTGTGIYLNSSGAVGITVRQKQFHTAYSSTRNSWQWGMASAPHKITSTFGVNSGSNNIPYSTATIYQIRIQVAGYYGRNDSLVLDEVGIYNNSDVLLANATNRTMTRASGSDTPLSPTFDIPDVAVSTGTYRIGFKFPGTLACQWDERTGVSGYTTYEDGVAVSNQSLLWEIDYFVLV